MRSFDLFHHDNGDEQMHLKVPKMHSSAYLCRCQVGVGGTLPSKNATKIAAVVLIPFGLVIASKALSVLPISFLVFSAFFTVARALGPSTRDASVLNCVSYQDGR